jgi:hypothetical protein
VGLVYVGIKKDNKINPRHLLTVAFWI